MSVNLIYYFLKFFIIFYFIKLIEVTLVVKIISVASVQFPAKSPVCPPYFFLMLYKIPFLVFLNPGFYSTPDPHLDCLQCLSIWGPISFPLGLYKSFSWKHIQDWDCFVMAYRSSSYYSVISYCYIKQYADIPLAPNSCQQLILWSDWIFVSSGYVVVSHNHFKHPFIWW